MSDDEEQDAMMREMMGFSSFNGTQRPPKEPKELKTGAPTASGANAAPLAKRAKPNLNPKSNARILNPATAMFWPASLPPPPSRSINTNTPDPHDDDHDSAALPRDIAHPPPQPSGTSAYARSAGGASAGPAPAPAPAVPEAPAYTNAATGISFTKSELNTLARGEKINARGDRVFFKPGFVMGDPWARVKEMKIKMNSQRQSQTSSQT